MVAALANELEYRHVSFDDLETRLGSNDDGSFKGYACRWDRVDSYGTTFTRSAFGDEKGGPLPLLWMHSPDDPVGVFSYRQDDEGLWIEGKYDETPEGQRAKVRAKSSAPGLSVGFVRQATDEKDETRITAAKLREVSQITLGFASQPGAELVAMRKAAELMQEMDPEQTERAMTVTTNPATDPVIAPDEPIDQPLETDDEPEKAPSGSLEDRLVQVEAAVNAWAGEDGEATIVGTYEDHVEIKVGDETKSLPYTVGEDGEVTLDSADPAEDAPKDDEEERSDVEEETDPEVEETPEGEHVISEEHDEDGLEPPIDNTPEEPTDEQRAELHQEINRMLLAGTDYPKV